MSITIDFKANWKKIKTFTDTEKAARFFATFILTRWLFPFRCKNCGCKLRKTTADDLPQETLKIFDGHPNELAALIHDGWHCPSKCTGESGSYSMFS